MPKGYYIAIEGIDGAGKSTLAKLLAELIAAKYPDREIYLTREAGSSSMGKKLRELAIGNNNSRPNTRALAFALDRALHIEENIIPALERGAIIISDRCFISTIVYQGCAEELPLHQIVTACNLALNGIVPDTILWIDTPAGIAAARLVDIGKQPDYFESKGFWFLSKLRDAYCAIDDNRLGMSINWSLTKVKDNGTPAQMAERLFGIVVCKMQENGNAQTP